MIELGSLGGEGEWSSAMAINARGQVVGTSSWKEAGSHVFLWQNGAMRDIGRFGWDTTVFPFFIDSAGRAAWKEKGQAGSSGTRDKRRPSGSTSGR